jgi:DNA-binding protein HU-beta
MNKEQLVVLLAQRNNKSKKEAERWLKHFIDISKEVMARRGTLRILTFGTFTTTRRKPRDVIHPATKQRIQIPGGLVPTFKPAKLLKKLVRGEIQIKRKRGRPPKNPEDIVVEGGSS